MGKLKLDGFAILIPRTDTSVFWLVQYHSQDGWIGMRNASQLLFAGWWFGTFHIFPYIGNNNPI